MIGPVGMINTASMRPLTSARKEGRAPCIDIDVAEEDDGDTVAARCGRSRQREPAKPAARNNHLRRRAAAEVVAFPSSWGKDTIGKTIGGWASMKASVLSFRAAVLMVVAGMIWGMVMAITADHSTFPAHAHLNLLGWVSLFLFGIYYHLHPAIDRDRLAFVQVLVWIAATVVLTIGVALVHSGHAVGDPIAAFGSIVVLADMLLFAWLVYRREKTALAARPSAAPAE